MKHKAINGFSLIEGLIAMLILSIGIIGYLQLMISLRQNSQRSHYTSIASHLATDIVHKIEANPTALTAYLNNIPSTQPSPLCYTNASCTPTEMANYDLYDWGQQLQTQLPNANAHICQDDSPNDGTAAAPNCNAADANTPYAVKIWWQPSNSTEKRYALSFVIATGASP